MQDKHSNTQAVFKLKPTPRSNNAVLKHVGYLKESEMLGDELYEIDTPKNIQEKFGKFTDFLGTIKTYDITAKVYKCNLLGSFIVGGTRFPAFNVSFMYRKNIVTGYLFNIFVYFDIDKTTKESLTTPQSYLNRDLSGKYVIKIDEVDEGVRKLLDKLYESFEDEAIVEVAEKYKDKDNFDQDKISEEIQNLVNSKKDYFNKLFDGFSLPNYPNDKIVVNTILAPLYKNPLFTKLLDLAMDVREIKRRVEMNADDEICDIPKRVLNINDVKNNPDIVNKFLGIE